MLRCTSTVLLFIPEDSTLKKKYIFSDRHITQWSWLVLAVDWIILRISWLVADSAADKVANVSCVSWSSLQDDSRHVNM